MLLVPPFFCCAAGAPAVVVGDIVAIAPEVGVEGVEEVRPPREGRNDESFLAAEKEEFEAAD